MIMDAFDNQAKPLFLIQAMPSFETPWPNNVIQGRLGNRLCKILWPLGDPMPSSLLTSLISAEYPPGGCVTLEVFIDGARPGEEAAVASTVAIAHNFVWPHGPYSVVAATSWSA